MKDNKIVILHVFPDGMHFKKSADTYDSVPNVENLYYLFSPDKDFVLKKIQDVRVKIITDFKEYVSYFSNPDIDVILFHSLPYQFYYLFDYIDDSKYVVWWMWGYDIYYAQGEYSPIVSLDNLYKPLTKQYMEQDEVVLKESGYNKICRYITKFLRLPIRIVRKIKRLRLAMPAPKKSQNEILARIDSSYAPMNIEYYMVKEAHPEFKATFFHRPRLAKKPSLSFHKDPGNILVNHSLSFTNNHLDVFNSLYDLDIEKDRKFIVPISYGLVGFKGNPENLINASNMDKDRTIWLTKILPLDEYDALLNSVTHAVFGMIRQQALGNVFLCVLKGVKIYLYKDSVVYKELKKSGYVCYTIEEDLTAESLKLCLREEDARNNYNHYMQVLMSDSPEECWEFLKNAVAEKRNNLQND